MKPSVARAIACGVVILIMMACSSERLHDQPRTSSGEQPQREVPSVVEQLTYSVIKTLPHDSKAFTQGLVVDGSHFLESTGQVGTSSLRRVEIATGKILKSVPLEPNVFGEGMTVLGDNVYVLTWLHQRGYVFNRHTLQQTGTFTYTGEGWGLTTDGTVLYMSNGTNVITARDPVSFAVLRTIPVTLSGRAIGDLNELEWIEGTIWANVWRTDNIVRIDPTNGKVTAVVDLTGLLPYSQHTADTDVLNGIAWDSTSKALYVTGKNWPHVYQIGVRPK